MMMTANDKAGAKHFLPLVCAGFIGVMSLLSPSFVYAAEGAAEEAAAAAAAATSSGSSVLIGCDPRILQQNQALRDALNQANIEATNQLITKPTPAEIATCGEQTLQAHQEIGKTFSDPTGGGNQASAGLLGGFKNFIGNLFNNGVTVAGSAEELIKTNYQKSANSFASGLSGGTSSALSANCDMMDQAWLIQDCMPMPQIPNISDIMVDKINDLAGLVTNLPQRMAQQVCNAASSKINGLIFRTEDAFNGAANALTDPVTDTFHNIGNQQNKAVNTIFQ